MIKQKKFLPNLGEFNPRAVLLEELNTFYDKHPHIKIVSIFEKPYLNSNKSAIIIYYEEP